MDFRCSHSVKRMPSVITHISIDRFSRDLSNDMCSNNDRHRPVNLPMLYTILGLFDRFLTFHLSEKHVADNKSHINQ